MFSHHMIVFYCLVLYLQLSYFLHLIILELDLDEIPCLSQELLWGSFLEDQKFAYVVIVGSRWEYLGGGLMICCCFTKLLLSCRDNGRDIKSKEW